MINDDDTKPSQKLSFFQSNSMRYFGNADGESYSTRLHKIEKINYSELEYYSDIQKFDKVFTSFLALIQSVGSKFELKDMQLEFEKKLLFVFEKLFTNKTYHILDIANIQEELKKRVKLEKPFSIHLHVKDINALDILYCLIMALYIAFILSILFVGLVYAPFTLGLTGLAISSGAIISAAILSFPIKVLYEEFCKLDAYKTLEQGIQGIVDRLEQIKGADILVANENDRTHEI